LSDGNNYAFAVIATNAYGSSGKVSVSAIPGALPVAPSYVRVGVTSPTSVSVSWPFALTTSSSGGWGVTNYVVTVQDAYGNIVQTLNTNSGTVHIMTVTGLVTGSQYVFTVTPQCANGTGLSAISSLTFIALGPLAPTSLTATASPQQVALSWSSSALNGLGVTFKIVVKVGNTVVGTYSTSATSLVVSNLNSGTAYTFVVSASNAYGVSPSAATTVTAL
jgi:hypothetical protein